MSLLVIRFKGTYKEYENNLYIDGDVKFWINYCRVTFIKQWPNETRCNKYHKQVQLRLLRSSK